VWFALQSILSGVQAARALAKRLPGRSVLGEVTSDPEGLAG
jgi:hypothetical protein